jgi:hypothetical protein
MSQAQARIPSERARDVREAATAAIRGGPLHVLPAVVATLVVATGAAAIILTVVPSSGEQPALNEWVRAIAAGSCATLGLSYLAHMLRRREPARARAARASDPGVVTALISLAIMSVLLLVPVYLLAARTHPPSEQWIGYGFFDKRWLTATFLLGTLGAMVVVTVVAQLVGAARSRPDSWRSWARAAIPASRTPAPGAVGEPVGIVRMLALVGFAFAFALYFFAPPWHPALSPVNLHESPMMSGIQAIANGAIPYIGSAAVQYGPGSELIQYLYLKVFGFDLIAFRQSTALLYLIAATIFFIVLFIRLPTRLALISSLVSVLLFPTLQMVSFQPDGSIDAAVDRLPFSQGGFWGWPNAMRYVGVFAVAMLFPAAAALKSRRPARVPAIALGALFGLTAYISQENLVGGITAVGVLAALLVVSRTLPRRLVGTTLLEIAIGFVAVASIVFAYYAVNGELGRFLQLYYLIPPAVAAGYSDTVYYGGFTGDWGRLYHLLPFLLGALCLLSLVRLHPFRFARGWSRERVLLVSALVAACVAEVGAMLRADSAHQVNTMLALPVALVLAVSYLPRLLGIASRRRAAVATLTLALAPLALLPWAQFQNIGNRLVWPLERASYESPAIAWQRANPNSVAAARLGPVLHRDGQWCCSYFQLRYPVTMREFADLLNRLHHAVGDRRVYVANFIEPLMPGAAYFLADLKPADVFFDQQTMAMNQRLLNDFLSYFRDHISEVGAVVAVYPDLPEARIFKAANPGYTETRLPFTWGTITVLTR